MKLAHGQTADNYGAEILFHVPSNCRGNIHSPYSPGQYFSNFLFNHNLEKNTLYIITQDLAISINEVPEKKRGRGGSSCHVPCAVFPLFPA